MPIEKKTKKKKALITEMFYLIGETTNGASLNRLALISELLKPYIGHTYSQLLDLYAGLQKDAPEMAVDYQKNHLEELERDV